MVATVAAGTTAAYYTSLADYYSGAHEPTGQWLAVGFAAGPATGSNVESETFARLHAALDTQSRSMLANNGGKVERVGGYDVTFSAPKSVSIAWALGDADLRSLIEIAQGAAVRSAIKILEENAAFCRSGKAGRWREAVRLTVAAFQHGGSRPETHADGAVFCRSELTYPCRGPQPGSKNRRQIRRARWQTAIFLENGSGCYLPCQPCERAR